MVEGPVDPRGARGVVHDEQHAIEGEAVDDGVQVALLVGEGVVVRRWLVRLAPTEEIEGHDVASLQVWNETVVEVVVVGEAVHQHDRRAIAGLLTNVDAVRASSDEAIAKSTPPGRRPR
jgi:hypothetical protein